FFFSSRRRHTRFSRDWSSDVALPICALHMQGPDCSRTHAKADLSTFGYDVLTAACRRTSCPLGLIEKVRELRPRPFESGRIDVEIGRASCRERVESAEGTV